MFVSHFYAEQGFVVAVLDKFFFFISETKKVVAGRVRLMVIWYLNDYIGIILGGLTIGRLRRVVAL